METFLMHGFPSNRYVRREREPCQFSYAIWNNRSSAPHCSYVFKSGKALYYDLSSEYFAAMGKLAAGEILSLSLSLYGAKEGSRVGSSNVLLAFLVRIIDPFLTFFSIQSGYESSALRRAHNALTGSIKIL